MKTQLTTKDVQHGLESQFLGLINLRDIVINQGEDTSGVDALINETVKEIEILQEFNFQHSFKMCSEFETKYFAYMASKTTFVN